MWSVFGKMSAGQSCDNVVDVVRLRQKKNRPIIMPIIVEFRSEYGKWTVMRMKAKLRECEEYRFFKRWICRGKREREVMNARVVKLIEDIIQKQATGMNGMATEKRNLAVVWKNDEIKREAV